MVDKLIKRKSIQITSLGQKRRAATPYLLLAPALIFALAIVVYPLIFSLRLSFYKWDILNPQTGRYFVGLSNFQSIFSDPLFWNAVKVTFTFMVAAVTLEFFFGLIIALCLSMKLKGIRIFRTILLAPMMVAPIVVGLLWRLMLNPDYGIVNYFFHIVGIGRQTWLSDPLLALPSLIFVDVWQWTPFVFLLLLAGIQALPLEPFEAAEIDGASRWQKFTKITLPLLRPVILITILIRSIDAFRVYDIIFIMTRGGPVNETETLVWQTYLVGFKWLDMGYAAALSWIVLILATIISMIYIRILSEEEV